MHDTCPKCGSLAYIKSDGVDVFRHCRHCGHLKFLLTKHKDGTIEYHADKIQTHAQLPRQGSKLRRVMEFLAIYGEQDTNQMSELMQDSIAKTASCLTVLRAKGLVISVTEGRGIKGGSRWRLTNSAATLLNIPKARR